MLPTVVCSQLSAASELETRYQYTGWRELVAPNGVGHRYLSLAVPDYRDFEHERCLADTRISLLQTRLAVGAYRTDNGKLPEGLGALVPNYGRTLPPDGFDGIPLQYSRARSELWSPADPSLSVTF